MKNNFPTGLIVATFFVMFAGCASLSDVPNQPDNEPDNNNQNQVTYTISGKITGSAVDGVTITLSGTATGGTLTDSAGSYSLTGLAAGDYTVTPTKTDAVFEPASTTITGLSADTEASFTLAAYQTVAIPSTATMDGMITRCSSTGEAVLDAGSATGSVGRNVGICDATFGDDLYRTYLSFDLAGSGIATSATVVSATLSFNQTTTSGNPYSGSLTINHVNYGDALDTADWGVATIEGSAVATNTNSSSGLVSIENLAELVQSDVGLRGRTQFSFEFPDSVNGYIAVPTGEDAENHPTLTVTYYQF